MASIRDIYGSRFLTTDDLVDGTLAGQIVEIGVEPFQDQLGRKKDKLVLRLHGVEKPIVVNATNADAIAEVLGDDYEQWPGAFLHVKIGKTRFAGKVVNCMVMSAALETNSKKPEQRGE